MLANFKLSSILIGGGSAIVLCLLVVGLLDGFHSAEEPGIAVSAPDSLPVGPPDSVADNSPDLGFKMREPLAAFRGGDEALDYVLAHADTMNSIHLLVGANTAYRLNRLQDAAFLFYAGRIRARYDLQKYQPMASGGDNPIAALRFLIANASRPIMRAVFFEAADYAGMVQRLEAWTIEESDDYDPGWAYRRHEVPDDLAAHLMAETLEEARPLATLLNIPEYMKALKTMREFNELPSEARDESVAIERYARAEQTMQRIELERDLKGIYCQLHSRPGDE
mgnify:FL=1